MKIFHLPRRRSSGRLVSAISPPFHRNPFLNLGPGSIAQHSQLRPLAANIRDSCENKIKTGRPKVAPRPPG